MIREFGFRVALWSKSGFPDYDNTGNRQFWCVEQLPSFLIGLAFWIGPMYGQMVSN